MAIEAHREAGAEGLSAHGFAHRLRQRVPAGQYALSNRDGEIDMPQWGLDQTMADTEPWGLASHWFESAKVITDPIQGDVYLNRMEQVIVDSPPFQRLRRIRQLGTVHLVYPGATHSRFTHSLGALRVVQNLFDIVLSQRNGRRPVVYDLFTQWDEEHKHEPEKYWRRVAEAMVLARLGALMHDLCHVPFGHSVEDDLEFLEPHDENHDRFKYFMRRVKACLLRDAREGIRGRPNRHQVKELQPLFAGRLRKQLEPLVLSKKFRNDEGKRVNPAELEWFEYPFVADMVGNTICADLLDYLERDHRAAGLPISLGRRYMSEFYVTPAESTDAGLVYPKRMAIRVHREGRPRPDVETELLKHLRYRYELQERVLVHHAKIGADAMVGKMLELYRAQAVKTKTADGAGDPEAAAKEWLEDVFRETGDDALLERIRDGSAEGSGAREMADDLLERRLYRRAASAIDASAREDLRKRFGSLDERRRLERKALEWAELPSDSHHVVLWVPPPDMRLKLAEMLVDYGRGIAKFVDHSTKGREIYDDHRALWTISLFVHRSVEEERVEEVIVRLAADMDVSWDRYVNKFGSVPREWPDRLAAMRACKSHEKVAELLKHEAPQLQSRGQMPNQTALLNHYIELGRSQGIAVNRKRPPRRRQA